MDFPLFRDAADPRALDAWTGPVQGYPNRFPAWTVADFARHAAAGIMRTSVVREISWAAVCREIDVESGAARPEDVPGFVMLRHHLGLGNAGVYCNLSTWPEVRRELEIHHITNQMCRVRIALWDGRPAPLAAGSLGQGWKEWAKQYQDTGPYDNNVAFENPRWSHQAAANGASLLA